LVSLVLPELEVLLITHRIWKWHFDCAEATLLWKKTNFSTLSTDGCGAMLLDLC